MTTAYPTLDSEKSVDTRYPTQILFWQAARCFAEYSWVVRFRPTCLRLILIGEFFFPEFPRFDNNWRYVSKYGGVLSLFVKFSRSKKIRKVKYIMHLEEKNGKILKVKKMREKIWKLREKRISHKNDPDFFQNIHYSTFPRFTVVFALYTERRAEWTRTQI